MTSITPSCAYCQHFNAEDREKETCTAFPKGIPSEILSGNNTHVSPFKGDNGIMFEPVAGFEFLKERYEEASK